MSAEVAPLGIKVLIVEPSAFRTDWAGRSAAEANSPIKDYDPTAGAVQRTIRSWSGNQAGDPARAAQAIVKAVEAENAPLRLLLGRGALAGARAKLEALKSDFDAWADVKLHHAYEILNKWALRELGADAAVEALKKMAPGAGNPIGDNEL